MTSVARALKASRLASYALRYERALYVLWAGLLTLASARTFYGYMLKQTSGEWSAPLDDVFIHFDYARSTAEGHPFEWVPGNGYSSGNTSLLYPFVLAAGYLVGFRGERLMIWAAIVAAVSVFGTLLAARRLFTQPGGARQDAPALLMRAAVFLLPPIFLGIGALNWSLWSGMEVAFFLAMWAAALLAFLALERAPNEALGRSALLLGAAGGLMVVTRPEAAGTIGAFGVFAAWPIFRRRGALPAARVLLAVGAPSVFLLGAQAVVNRVFTGEFSANGAIVKLATNSPFMTRKEMLADYLFNLKYAVLRCVEYHFTDAPAFGFILPALGLAAVAVPSTRRWGLLLWSQIGLWLVLVAFNGQVRWQNERYVMPAVAWLLVAAALGVAALMRRRGRPNLPMMIILGALALQAIGVATRPPNTNPEFRFAWSMALAAGVSLALLLRVWPLRLACVAGALYLAHDHQQVNHRNQKWFFGRASRNIRDQHIVAGRWLAKLRPKRILVGDAGALIYASGRPGLDIIGLGASTSCRSRAPACTGCRRRSSSSSACPRPTAPTSSPSSRRGGACCPRGSPAGSWRASPSPGTSSAAATRT